MRFKERSARLYAPETLRDVLMYKGLIGLGLLLALSGCISLGFGTGGAPQRTTIVVPQGATVTCTNANGTPCQAQ
jgi:hypothetical protein